MGKSLNYKINVLVGKKINNGVGNQNGTTMFPSKDILTLWNIYYFFTTEHLLFNHSKVSNFKYKVI
jgi:hypothetical protein